MIEQHVPTQNGKSKKACPAGGDKKPAMFSGENGCKFGGTFL